VAVSFIGGGNGVPGKKPRPVAITRSNVLEHTNKYTTDAVHIPLLTDKQHDNLLKTWADF
jgi:hypothetical protein